MHRSDSIHKLLEWGRIVPGFQHKFPGSSVVKNLPANAGDVDDPGSIPGSGRFPGEGNGNPLQYSYLENPKDRRTQWATVHGIELDTAEVT